MNFTKLSSTDHESGERFFHRSRSNKKPGANLGLRCFYVLVYVYLFLLFSFAVLSLAFSQNFHHIAAFQRSSVGFIHIHVHFQLNLSLTRNQHF